MPAICRWRGGLCRQNIEKTGSFPQFDARGSAKLAETSSRSLRA